MSLWNKMIAVNYFRKTPHHRCSTRFWICLGFSIWQRSEYTGVLNIPGWKYARVLNMILVLNIPGFLIYYGSECARVTKCFEYVWTIPGYDWLCLNVSKSVWMAFVLHLPIVIPYLKELYTVFLESKNLFFSYSSCKFLI